MDEAPGVRRFAPPPQCDAEISDDVLSLPRGVVQQRMGDHEDARVRHPYGLLKQPHERAPTVRVLHSGVSRETE